MPSPSDQILTSSSSGIHTNGRTSLSRPDRKERQRRALEYWGERSSAPKKATILKEYELVRSEITTSLQIQQQILGFGIATIGLLAGAAFVAKDQPLRSKLLVVFLPLVSYLAVTIWFSEVMRMFRAGGFLLMLEKKLDDHGDGTLKWEYEVARSRLGQPGRNPYSTLDPDRVRLLAVTALFFILSAESIMLGWEKASLFARAFAITAGGLAAIVLRLLFRLRIHQRDDLLGFDPDMRGVEPEVRLIGCCIDALERGKRVLGGRIGFVRRAAQRAAA
jgi:hypothetical protein